MIMPSAFTATAWPTMMPWSQESLMQDSKKEAECENYFDKWLYVLMNMDTLESELPLMRTRI